MPIPIPKSAQRLRGLIRGSADAAPAGALDNLAEGMTSSNAASKAATKSMGGADTSLSYSQARQLALSSDPSDRLLLQEAFENMGDAQKKRFMDSLVLEGRDPTSPASAPRLSEEGQIIEAVVEGRKPKLPPERVAAIRAAAGDGGMADVDTLPDISEKSAPPRPLSEKSMKERDLQVPDGKKRFRSTEKVKRDKKTGLPSIEHSDVSLDRQTNAAIRRAEKTGTADPISEKAALMGDKSPEQSYVESLKRTLKLRDPNGVRGGTGGDALPPSGKARKAESNPLDADATGRDRFAEADRLSPGDDKGISKRKPQSSSFDSAGDFGDIRYLLDSIGVNGVPNARFGSPQEAAEAIISGAPQDMFNATPVAASERARLGRQLMPEGASPEGMPPELAPTPQALRLDLNELDPDLATRLTQKGRGSRSVQQQAIDALARKLDEFYGSSGWGDAYKGPDEASSLPSKSTRPPERTLDLESEIPRSTDEELAAFEAAGEYDPTHTLDLVDAGTATKLPEPVGPRMEPAGDLTGVNDALAADRIAKRQAVIDRIKENFPGENFTTRRTKEIQADILAQGVDGDPDVMEALQRELRAAQHIDSYLSTPDRMAGKGKRGRKANRKANADAPPEARSMDLDGKPLDDLDAAKSADGAADDLDSGKNADGVDDAKKTDGATPEKKKMGWKKKAAIAAAVGVPAIGTIRSILNSSKEFPEGGTVLPGAGGGAEAEPMIDEAAFSAAVGGGVRPTTMSPEERLRVLSRAFDSPLNKNTQTLSNWRD